MQKCLFGDLTPDHIQILHLFSVSSLLLKIGLFVVTH